jgi:predicted AAA+ superfamily ATPase
VLLYATSNRRNLIRESFAEREEDVHAQDTAREKLSLAARFGLRVTFLAPDQKKYLQMVENLAGIRGLEIAGEELQEKALAWERRISARSGRTARQFVDELQAGLSEENPRDGERQTGYKSSPSSPSSPSSTSSTSSTSPANL